MIEVRGTLEKSHFVYMAKALYSQFEYKSCRRFITYTFSRYALPKHFLKDFSASNLLRGYELNMCVL